MQEYACGFLFSTDRHRLLLIRKRRPVWQAGHLNGVGGKLERGETPIDAMKREFREEASLDIADWQPCLTLTGPDWRGHFFRAFGDIDSARALTDEPLEVHLAMQLPPDVIPNLKWMVPLLLDDEAISRQYRIDIGLGGRDQAFCGAGVPPAFSPGTTAP